MGLIILLVGAWLLFNPIGSFGWCRFGITTYSAVPRPISDLQVRSDGKVRSVEKTHDLGLDRVSWLLDPKPDVLIIATGWSGVTKPREEITKLQGFELRILTTGDAIKLFNKLRKESRRVAIHLHSTC